MAERHQLAKRLSQDLPDTYAQALEWAKNARQAWDDGERLQFLPPAPHCHALGWDMMSQAGGEGLGRGWAWVPGQQAGA